MKRSLHHPERGNAGFYILLAIALLAALSYAVSKGSRFGTKTLTDDEARLAAQEIIDYGNAITDAVQKLRLRGFTDTQIDFSTPVYQFLNGSTMAPANPNCSSEDCKVFSTGGQIIARTFIDASIDVSGSVPATWGKNGHILVRDINVEGVGTSENDLVMQVLSLSAEVCQKINELEDTLVAGATPVETYGAATPFIGTYASSYADTLGDSTGLSGKTSLCIDYDGTGFTRHYTKVLIAR